MDELLKLFATKISDHTKRKAIALMLSVFSILANFMWVTLPFYFYGLRGRSGVLYGQYTLLQTFSFHLSGWVWWALVGLQVFATLTIVTGVSAGHGRAFRVSIFAVPAMALLLLDAYVAYRWGTLALWTMYVIGALPSLLLTCAGARYAKSY